MSGFFLSLSSEVGSDTPNLNSVRRHFERSGLGRPTTIKGPNFVFDFYPRHGCSAADGLVRTNETDFIAGTGTFIFRGCTGVDALKLLWNECNPAATLDDCRGHFAVFVFKNGRMSLLRDRLATYEIYYGPALKFISSSFLAIAAATPKLTADSQGCMEYVAKGVTIGTSTPFHEVKRLDIVESIIFDPLPRVRFDRVKLCPPESQMPLSVQVADNLGRLRTHIEALAAAFPGRVRLSFSGGYDSRLLLGLFRSCGVRPGLFVYGPNSHIDVHLAKQIAEGEGISLEHVDKAVLRPADPESELLPAEMVRRNYHANEGLWQYGIFKTDHEYFARIDRSKDQSLVVNSGGGEIFRNFFKFRDSPIHLTEFVNLYFGDFDPDILAEPACLPDFESKLMSKITMLLDLDRPALTRRQMECLYPHLRCRSWFGYENSVNCRFGNAILPFYDQHIVDGAMSVPVRWKHFGNFQSRLIQELDPKLARYQSSSGFRLDRKTPLKGMLPDLALFAFPPRLRRYNYRIKRLVGRSAERPLFLRDSLLKTLFDVRFPYLSKLFRIDRVRDDIHFNRVCTLEYMFQNLNALDMT